MNKRFGANQTIHGQYFTMRAVVRVKYDLRNRDGAVIYSGDVSGTENEPPNPVGAEVFLPLETDPAESLSVALSRAVGQLMLQPAFRDALPTANYRGDSPIDADATIVSSIKMSAA